MSGLLTNSPQEVVAALLVQIGQAGDADANPLPAWPAYVDDEPDAPDSTVTVYGTTGIKDSKEMITGYVSEHHGIQIRVRGPAQANPGTFQKINAITQALNPLHNVSVTIGSQSFTVGELSQQGTILPLGRDAPNTNRRLYVVNYTVTVREVVTP